MSPLMFDNLQVVETNMDACNYPYILIINLANLQENLNI
jgi:hypothetical protein